MSDLGPLRYPLSAEKLIPATEATVEISIEERVWLATLLATVNKQLDRWRGGWSYEGDAAQLHDQIDDWLHDRWTAR